jgi:hypothetical protein
VPDDGHVAGASACSSLAASSTLSTLSSTLRRMRTRCHWSINGGSTGPTVTSTAQIIDVITARAEIPATHSANVVAADMTPAATPKEAGRAAGETSLGIGHPSRVSGLPDTRRNAGQPVRSCRSSRRGTRTSGLRIPPRHHQQRPLAAGEDRVAHGAGKHRGVDVRRAHRGDGGPGPGRGDGNVPRAARRSPCWPAAHWVCRGYGATGTASSAGTANAAPMRAQRPAPASRCAPSAASMPARSPVRRRPGRRSAPAASGTRAADADQEPGTCGHKPRGYRGKRQPGDHRSPAARGFPSLATARAAASGAAPYAASSRQAIA